MPPFAPNRQFGQPIVSDAIYLAVKAGGCPLLQLRLALPKTIDVRAGTLGGEETI